MSDSTQIAAVATLVADSGFKATVASLTTISEGALPACNTATVLKNFLVCANALMQLAQGDVAMLNPPVPVTPAQAS